MEKNHSNPFHLWFSLFGRDASCCRPTENREGHCRRHLNRISKLVTQNQDSLSCHPLFQLCHPALCVWIALALALLLACMPSSQFFGQLKVMEKLTKASLIFISILSAIILINDLFENYKYHCLPFFFYHRWIIIRFTSVCPMWWTRAKISWFYILTSNCQQRIRMLVALIIGFMKIQGFVSKCQAGPPILLIRFFRQQQISSSSLNWLQLVDYDFLFLPGDNNRVEPWVL